MPMPPETDQDNGSGSGSGQATEAAAAEAAETSITGQARQEFNRPEYEAARLATKPIAIRGLSLKKDTPSASSFSTCTNPSDEDEGLKMAPNFASAVMGKWLASKLGMGGRPPPKIRDTAAGDRDRSDSAAFVFQNVNAVLLPGEGTLLLGPSSSGKTSLMRTICNLIGGSIKPDDESSVEGTMRVGGVDPSRLGKNQKRRCAFVDQSDLTLTPTLTVEETIRFARSCAEGDLGILEESLRVMFELCGLDHVTQTVVGDADLRGVSGGQKRRVKMLEMAVGIDATIFFLDEITNGLDAASALSICKVVAAALDVGHATAITCLLQPSSEVFQTFQRLILLTPDGKVAYSGRLDRAVAHFESLGLTMPKGGMNEPEFLLRCTSTPADFWEDEEKGPIPPEIATSDALADTFIKSDAGRALEQELDMLDNHERIEQDGDKSAGLSSYAQPTRRQIGLLIRRGMTLVKRNPASSMRIVSAIIFGVFIGTLFLNTPADEKGTSVRAGYVLTLIFLSFLNSCMSPLDDLYKDRITFYAHRSASFYSTVSYYISQVICSLPVAILEALFLSLLSFFAVGMNGGGGWKFFYFLAQFSLLAWAGSSVSRVLAYSLPTNDMAQSLGPAALLLFVLSACYSPQYRELPNWLTWLAWISPCAYTYEGVMVSEGMGRNVGNATGVEFLQSALGIPRIPYSAAPSGISTEGLVLAFDAYILIVLIVVFEVLGCFLLHHSQKWFGPNTKRYQVASGMMLSAPPWMKPADQNSSDEDGGSQRKLSIPDAPPAHLTVKDIVYEVDVPAEIVPASDDKAENEEAPQGSGVDKTDVPEEDSEFRGIPMTTREYGQARKGAAQEWVIRRQLGDDAVSVRSSTSTSAASSLGSELLPRKRIAALEPPEPGRHRLLSGITATFEPSTMTALMGSSGAGKSTLLDVIAGYKTGGHILGSVNVNGLPKTDATWRSIAGYCEQTDCHNPAMTVRESLIFAARMRLRPFSIPDNEKIDFASEILNLLELEEFGDMLVGDEASGEGLPKHARKRLTVGVELCSNPSILFADEPTSGLDSLSAAVVVGALQRAAKKGLTVVCTIHQPSRDVFQAFDNILLLRKGGVCVFNGSLSSLDNYIASAPDGKQYAMIDGANPADHVLDVFCGPRGAAQDWSELYEKSEMARIAKECFHSCSCDSCAAGEIRADSTPQSFASELYILLQRQILSHYRTPTYMAVRFWWTVVANLIVGLVYFQATTKKNSVTNVIGSIFFYVNIATVPLLSAVAPLIAERAVYYREIASGTYSRIAYGLAVQLAEIPFNLCFAVVSFLIFYFMVGLKGEAENVIYFLLMALAAYWVLPTFGQLFAFLSPNIGAAVGVGSLLMTLFTLTMGFLIPASDIPPWYIWLYWINPLRYILQGMVSNELGGDSGGDEVLDALVWRYQDRWWYCFVVTVLFGLFASVGTLAATRISWLKR